MTRQSAPFAECKSCHATAVVVEGRALLITGKSGSGKSALAMEMIALGAQLICDDQVILTRDGDVVTASAPGDAPALIEARGVGLVSVGALAPPAPVALVMDMDAEETDRLPKARFASLLGIPIRSLRKPERLSAAALVLALREYGLIDPEQVSSQG